MSSTTATLLLVALVHWSAAKYAIPEPKFEFLKPSGFRASIPDEEGILFFGFHANINKPMEFNGVGQMALDVVNKTKGRWVYENKKAKLRRGDVINYWTTVFKNGVGYRRDFGVYNCEGMDFYRQTKKHLEHTMQKRFAHYPQDNWDGEGYHYPRPPYDCNANKYPFHPRRRQPGQPRYDPWHAHHGYGYPPYEHHNHNPYNHNHNHNHHNHNHHNFGDEDDDEDSAFKTTTTEGIPREPETIAPTPTPTAPSPTTTPTAPSPTTTEEAIESTTTIQSSSIPDIDIRFGEKTDVVPVAV